MALAEMHREQNAEFNYHLLRSALDRYGRNLGELQPEQYDEVQRRASRSYDLESLVLEAPEAEGLVIPDEQLEASLAEVASRYPNEAEFLADLQANGLDRDGLRRALRRELAFDAVMQRVGARGVDVNDIDIRLFYEMHSERFEAPELRTARHILITVNPEYVDNTRPNAMARMQEVAERLRGRANRFHDMARRYSECPTAMEGGRLGEVQRGTLYPQLDAELFRLNEGEVSDIVESEIGLHILLCEKIKPGKRVSISKAAPKIRAILEERRRRNCQKAWLSELQQSAG
jgi:peptidyl-prolyl cis-trans isomerase C